MAPMLYRLQCVKYTSTRTLKGILLGMSSANERRCCTKTSSLIGWAHIENDLCASVGPIAWLSMTGCKHGRHGSIPPLIKMELANQPKYIRNIISITGCLDMLKSQVYLPTSFWALVKLVSGECQRIQSVISHHWGDFASDSSAPRIKVR